MYKFRLIIWIVTTLLCLPILAESIVVEEEQLHFRRFSAKDGLPSVYINTILQRHNGLMWIGTKGGLARFDGQNMANYFYKPNNNNSLGADDVISLFEDNHSKLWVGTTKGLYLYHDTSDDFSPIKLLNKQTKPSIFHISQDSHNNYWIGTNQGVFVLNSELTIIWHSLEKDSVKFIGQSHPDKIWIGTKRGLLLINPKNYTLTTLSAKNESAPHPYDLRVYDGLIDNKTLWLATDKDGLIKIDTSTNKIINQFSDDNKLLNNRSIWSLTKRGDDIWLGYFYDGISRFNTTTRKNSASKNHSHIDYTIPHNNVSKVYFDNTGLLWVATTNGLSVTDPNNSVIKQLGEYQKVTNKHVWSIAKSKEDIWFGTENGLNQFNINTNTLKTYPSANEKGALPRTIIWSIAPYQDDIWLGTNQGLFKFSPQTNKVSVFENDFLKENNINNQSIYTMTLLQDELLIGFYNGAVAKFNLENEHFYETFIDVSSGYITNITPHQDSLLVASQYGLYNLHNGVSEKILAEHNLANYHITSMKVINNQIWLATLSNGLFILNNTNEQWRIAKHLTMDDNLPENTVKAISTDLQGNVWLVGRKAIYQINPLTFGLTLFTSQFYWLDMEFHDNATNKDSIDLQLFGGNEGLVFFPSEALTKQSSFPELTLSSIQITNTQFRKVNNNNEITIKPGESFYSFNVSALEFLSPESIKYQYKLSPGQNQWNSLDNSKITLSNLPYNEYKLHIRATNSDQIFNKNELEINLNVTPPFWWTSLAKVIYLTLLLFIIISFIVSHKQRLKRMTYKARHDALTGLPNRDYLLNELNKKIANANTENNKIAVLFFDLNGFKLINDTFGHDAGDALLKHVAKQVQSCIREKDFFARQSGDEFIMLLDSIKWHKDISHTIERVQSAFKQVFTYHNKVINYGSSIGISVYDSESNHASAEELIKQADEAMYRCKKDKAPYCYY